MMVVIDIYLACMALVLLMIEDALLLDDDEAFVASRTHDAVGPGT